MSSIGPDLPPHLLAKRKRDADEAKGSQAKAFESDPPARSPNANDKRRRMMGPTAPPAALNEMPTKPADSDEDSDSSDDDYGPSIPTGETSTKDDDENADEAAYQVKLNQVAEHAMKRDDWMMLPPSADGLAKNMDPTRPRPGKFRSGKGAAANGGEMDSSWTETPEEKRKRLANQVLGVAPAPSSKNASESARSKQDDQSAKRIKEYNEKHRGKSLYEQHQGSKEAEKEDDPSKRAFDREKDIGGAQIGRSQRKELMNRAANFGSKFSGGKYL